MFSYYITTFGLIVNSKMGFRAALNNRKRGARGPRVGIVGQADLASRGRLDSVSK